MDDLVIDLNRKSRSPFILAKPCASNKTSNKSINVVKKTKSIAFGRAKWPPRLTPTFANPWGRRIRLLTVKSCSWRLFPVSKHAVCGCSTAASGCWGSSPAAVHGASGSSSAAASSSCRCREPPPSRSAASDPSSVASTSPVTVAGVAVRPCRPAATGPIAMTASASVAPTVTSRWSLSPSPLPLTSVYCET